jgi:hypothetical protein
MYNSELIWYNKKDVLDIFPITERTYFRKLKKIESHIRVKKISNPQGRETNLIHRDDLRSIFMLSRIPKDIENSTIKKKYIGTKKWDFIGNIVPEKSQIKDLVNKMDFLHQSFTKLDPKCMIFYSIEKNKNDDYYHSHFLMETTIRELDIMEYLNLVCEENTRFNTRIHLEKYNYTKFNFKGSFYSFKTTSEMKQNISVFNKILYQ